MVRARAIAAILLAVVLTFACSLPSFAGSTALIIIDMQPEFATRSGYLGFNENEKKLKEVISRQIDLIREAKQFFAPIIVVEYARHGSTHPDIQKELQGYEHVKTFVKSTDGVFDSRSQVDQELIRHLDKRNVTDIIMVGANGGACVFCSIQGGLMKGYRIWAEQNAIIDLNHRNYIKPYVYDKDGFFLGDPSTKINFGQSGDREQISRLLDRNDVSTPSALESRRAGAPFCRGLFFD